ncbi:energy-coupling factor transporter ATPase [Anoxybacter fermentans]|uniref:Energy-coupling factor transporter ATP-binding protein EcfA2 n=1 Tax=Anoxybacter fermentans TaxID=1323375 RepID=A0A3Q9HSN8_9FIRM|nr:energy-coupling factor transporter ATPase [Anoxybacter fermentans]AZR74748.1 energy-coupling factor transporter ATPase [Anoxybacter fermentans]
MLIRLENVSHIYDKESGVVALKNINLSIKKGEFIGLVGHTGSGKSTLVQTLNGLIRPSKGKVWVDNEDITKSGVNLKTVRQKIGLVFQYPEHQLFEETVEKDISFGPRNLGLNEDEILKRVQWAMRLVGLNYEEFRNRSPFQLSGGQKRKVAIAGVLAMKPQVLILDEPSAGLDPMGRNQLLQLLALLNKDYQMTIILVSHRMEEVAELANRLLVMNKGELVLDDTPRNIFQNVQLLEEIGLGIPQVTRLLWELKKRGCEVRTDLLTLNEVKEEIIKFMGSKRLC